MDRRSDQLHELAATLLGAASGLMQTWGLHGRAPASARGAAFQEAFQRGEDLEDAVAFALQERPHTAAPARRAPRKPKPDSARLTWREREIAGFIARGMTNREIKTLVIAPAPPRRTWPTILSKLGFTSRAQVSSWVAENRGDRS